jgi:hypothetical protein
MIVYVHHLYWGLFGAAALGLVLGITLAWWWDERQRIIRVRRDAKVVTLGRNR